MKTGLLGAVLILCAVTFHGCFHGPASQGEKVLVPLKEANLEAVFEENAGLEVVMEDVKDLRDFYRGGVQKKARAEEKFREKSYAEAQKLYQLSSQFFSTLLDYLDEDSASFSLFEGTDILFFPNLLVADNHFKMGLIFQAQNRESAAKKEWKRALASVRTSLKSEKTEWGLALEQELLPLLAPKKN